MMFNMSWRSWDVITAKNVDSNNKNHHQTTRTSLVAFWNVLPVTLHCYFDQTAQFLSDRVGSSCQALLYALPRTAV